MAAASGVTASKSVILREWAFMKSRSVALRFVSRTSDIERHVAALEQVVPGLVDRVGDKATITGPLQFLDGVVVLIYDCVEKPVFLGVIDELVETMNRAGLHGRFTAGGGYTPLQHNDGTSGYGAGVVLPATLVHRDEWGMPTWLPDPHALEQVVQYALDWCELDGARYWIETGVGVIADEVYRDQLPALLRASPRQSPYTTIAAIDGRRAERASTDYRAEAWDIAHVRRVLFEPDGNVSFHPQRHSDGTRSWTS